MKKKKIVPNYILSKILYLLANEYTVVSCEENSAVVRDKEGYCYLLCTDDVTYFVTGEIKRHQVWKGPVRSLKTDAKKDYSKRKSAWRYFSIKFYAWKAYFTPKIKKGFDISSKSFCNQFQKLFLLFRYQMRLYWKFFVIQTSKVMYFVKCITLARFNWTLFFLLFGHQMRLMLKVF